MQRLCRAWLFSEPTHVLPSQLSSIITSCQRNINCSILLSKSLNLFIMTHPHASGQGYCQRGSEAAPLFQRCYSCLPLHFKNLEKGLLFKWPSIVNLTDNHFLHFDSARQISHATTFPGRTSFGSGPFNHLLGFADLRRAAGHSGTTQGLAGLVKIRSNISHSISCASRRSMRSRSKIEFVILNQLVATVRRGGGVLAFGH